MQLQHLSCRFARSYLQLPASNLKTGKKISFILFVQSQESIRQLVGDTTASIVSPCVFVLLAVELDTNCIFWHP
jgi:ABC-type bacteriocin/lantibiotic exporter with double-glycine peptidase domain